MRHSHLFLFCGLLIGTLTICMEKQKLSQNSQAEYAMGTPISHSSVKQEFTVSLGEFTSEREEQKSPQKRAECEMGKLGISSAKEDHVCALEELKENEQKESQLSTDLTSPSEKLSKNESQHGKNFAKKFLLITALATLASIPLSLEAAGWVKLIEKWETQTNNGAVYCERNSTQIDLSNHCFYGRVFNRYPLTGNLDTPQFCANNRSATQILESFKRQYPSQLSCLVKADCSSECQDYKFEEEITSRADVSKDCWRIQLLNELSVEQNAESQKFCPILNITNAQVAQDIQKRWPRSIPTFVKDDCFIVPPCQDYPIDLLSKPKKPISLQEEQKQQNLGSQQQHLKKQKEEKKNLRSLRTTNPVIQKCVMSRRQRRR